MILHRLLALGLCATLTAPAFAEAPARKDLLGDLLPEGAVSRMGSGRLRSSTGINCLTFTPDGKSLVSGCHQTNKLTFWSVATGKIDKEWTLGSMNVSGIHFDKLGKTVAVASGNGTVRILDGATGKERRQVVDSTQPYNSPSLTLSPDGKWLVMNHRNNFQIVIFDVETGVLKHRITNINSYNRPNVVFTPDGKQFVSLWADHKLHLVDVATGKSVRGLETGSSGPTEATRSNYSTRITAMALSSDGKKLVYRTYSDRHFHVVDVTNGKEVKKFERGNGAYYASSGSMALTPNDRFIVESGGDASIRVWGVASGKMLRELSVPNTSLNLSTTTPDGKLVATAYGIAIYLWDIASGKQLHGSAGHAHAVSRLVFTRDGKYLVSGDSNSMRVWESATGKERFVTRSNVYGQTYLDVAPDNKTVRWVGYDRAAYRWQFDSDRDPVKLTTPKAITGVSYAQATSPDGKVNAVFTAPDGKVRLLDNLGNSPDRELGRLPTNHSVSFQFSPDSGTLAVISSSDRSVTLYDVATGNETRKFMPDPSNTIYYGNLIQFSPDSRVFLKYDGEMRVVETMSGSDRALLSRESAGAPSSMNWSSDGRLVARGFTDGLALVTDTWTGREVFRRETGQGSVTSLCLSRDGKYLATGGMNTTAIVWDLPPTGRPSRVASMTEEAAWSDLEASDASRAQRAMLHMIAGPDETVRLFTNRLKPRPAVNAKRIDRLVKDLDDDDYKVRGRAKDELREIGMLAGSALKKAARSTSLEAKRSARDLLRRLEPGTSVAPDRLRAQRAVEILERIGTPAARTVLETMLESRLDATLEASIRSSLGRMRAG